MFFWDNLFSGSPLDAAGNPALTGNSGVIALLAANLYVICFGFSWGSVVWVMLGEMFNNRMRGAALSVAAAAQWIANAGCFYQLSSPQRCG